MNLHMSLWVSHQWVLFQVLNRVGEKSSKENENHSIRGELRVLEKLKLRCGGVKYFKV
jgi:hypothetical protein